MIIRRLAIRNFGKIHNTSLELTPFINVLYGENESGKTTVHQFIKSMLYGMQRARGKAAKSDVYSRYEPWENPAEYGGILWFENGGKVFRLSRSFARERMDGELYCESDGELLDLDEGDLDMLLGGVSETVFENTFSVAQMKGVTGKELAQELQNYMAGYAGTGDASIDLGRTFQMLKMLRKGFSVQEERAKRDREAAGETLRGNYAYVLEELNELQEKNAELSEKNRIEREESDQEKKALEMHLSDLEIRKKTWKISLFFSFLILGLLSVLLSHFFSFPYIWAFPIGICVLFFCVAFFCLKRLEEQRQDVRRYLHRFRKKEEKRRWDEENYKETLLEKETALQNLYAEMAEYGKENPQSGSAQTEVDAINMALRTMEELTGQFQEQIGSRLKKRTAEIVSEITDQKYEDVQIDAAFRIQVNDKERLIPVENLSRGTLEQIYFALRMAAGEILCCEERFPIILDDTFGMYDEDRLAAILKWLQKENRQVIISTCNKREMEILSENGIPYHKIFLNT